MLPSIPWEKAAFRLMRNSDVLTMFVVLVERSAMFASLSGMFSLWILNGTQRVFQRWRRKRDFVWKILSRFLRYFHVYVVFFSRHCLVYVSWSLFSSCIFSLCEFLLFSAMDGNVICFWISKNLGYFYKVFNSRKKRKNV